VLVARGWKLLSDPTPTPALALRPREASLALGISERTLWTLTAAGKVPHVRLGKAILYPIDELRRWLSAAATVTPTK